MINEGEQIILNSKLNRLSKCSIDDRLQSLELAMIFLLKENGCNLCEEFECAYLNCERCNIDQDTYVALSMYVEEI